MLISDLEKIYSDYKSGLIDTSELLCSLSLWDSFYDESFQEFTKCLRIRRTIVTELNRYSKLSKKERKIHMYLLKKKYFKEFLYSFTFSGKSVNEFSFTDYVRNIVESHNIPNKQYKKLKRKNVFWNSVEDLEKEIK